jgi:hypothetical protein
MSEIIITTISKKEIQKIIENAVETAILQKSTKDKKLNDTFLDVDHAATFLGIAKATLYGKCSKLLIPHFKKGKKLYFRQFELIEYLKSGKRNTVNDIEQNVNSLLYKRSQHLKSNQGNG